MTKRNEDVLKIKALIEEEGSVSPVLQQALNRLADDVVDQVIVTDEEAKHILRRLTRNPELRWIHLLKRLRIRCPECMNRLDNTDTTCARFSCYKCGETVMVHWKSLRGICQTCISFHDGSCKGPVASDFQDAVITKLPPGAGKKDAEE